MEDKLKGYFKLTNFGNLGAQSVQSLMIEYNLEFLD